MELSGVSRATGPSQPFAASRRAEDVFLALAARASGAEPALQRRSVEPVFRRPALDAPASRRASEAAVGPSAKGAAAQAAREAVAAAPPAPPFEWLDLEIIPLGKKPDPRGYAVYSQRPQPAPAPVILIDAA